jgi:phage terminase large subunit
VPEIKLTIDQEKFLPVYRHLIVDGEIFDIDFLFGGRDSGKSRHIAMQLIVECLRQETFRCLMIRKVLNTVRDSQYSLIQSIIEEWGIKHLFRFNSSRLEITCINGNGFFGRGLDDVGRIKSFNNPSACWIEEGNQIDAEDFVVVLTSLRNNNARVKTWFSFNPECEVSYTDFWLWQEYFMHTENYNFTWIKKIEVDDEIIEFKVRATHATYRDNPYCKPQRKALYESYKNSKNNEYWYQVYTLGLWGFKRPGGTFLKCFESDTHTLDLNAIPQIKNGDWTLHIVADNNVAPYVSIQLWIIDLKGKALLQIGELPCVHPDNTATKAALKVVHHLQRKEYNNTLYIYGDPSANAKSTTDDEGRSFFDKFIGTIKDSGYKIVNRVGKSAPSVSQSGSFVNEIFEANFMGWKIFIDKSCRKSVEDYNMTVEAMDGTILKKRVMDKQSGQTYEKYGHMTDNLRYFTTTTLKDEYKQFMQRRLGIPSSGGVAKVKRYKQKLG